MDALLSARALTKGYRTPAGAVPVLLGVDLDVAAGEMVAIVGASGVGKSTLLHVLGTLDRPDGGSLRIEGEDVLALAEARRCAFRNRTLGFVFQFHHLLPEFSALENVTMPLLIAGRPVAEARRRAASCSTRSARGRADHRPGRSRAASSSGSRWPAPSWRRRGRSWPTSRPATSTGPRGGSCTRRCGRSCGRGGSRWWS